YDPATRTWTPTGSLAEARKGHQATALPDGRVLVTGGDPVVAPDGTLDPHSLAGAELYDPKTGEWNAVASMPGGGRSGHRNLLLRSGVVLVIGGTGAPELTAGYRSVIAYSPEDDAWTTIGGLGLGRSALGAVELADDRVLVAGGVAAAGSAAESLDAVQPADTGEVLIP
ncbi:Kelch repeat-containing protein, partial [Streptomyces umbrinus]